MPKQRSPETTPRPSLLVSKEEAANKITRQIEQGRQLDNVDIRDDDSLQNVRASKTRWVSYTVELLSRIFDHESIANDFEHTYGTVNYRASFPQLVRSLKEEIAKKVTKLESVVERLELIPEVTVKPRISPESVVSTTSKEIFIVHGRDEAAKESVSRFIERLGLRAIILHEGIVNLSENRWKRLPLVALRRHAYPTCGGGISEIIVKLTIPAPGIVRLTA